VKVLPRRLTDAARLAGQLAFLSRSQWWDRDRIRDWQSRRLAAILGHAVTRVPYYAGLGIDVSAGASALDRFPLLTKDIVQTQGARLRDPSFADATLHASTTSGSSGQPTTTWFDREAWLLCKHALKIRRTLAGGGALGGRLMIFGEPAPGETPPAPVPRHRLTHRELRLSVFLPPAEQHQALTEFRPTMIYGAPSALGALCDHAREHGLPLPPVRTVFLSSELVTPRLRARLERDLHCRVIGVYGSTEFKEVAWQCPEGRYHLNFESVHVENLPAETAGGEPRIALTTLVNRAMPLIRFDIGDYGRLGDASCACGRESPWLADIAGRRVEYLALADGRRISPYLLTTHIETVEGLRQYQIVQRADGALELRVVFHRDHEARAGAAEALRRTLGALVGPGTAVRVVEVDAIERTPAGKHQVVTRET
jgi:phenylacetate-CoA ligase